MFLKIQFIVIFIYLTLFSKCHSKSLDTLVNTKVGLIRGLKAEDGEYSMFLGIPFGKVEENNPFGPSIPYGHFDGVFDANDDSAICPQTEEFNNTIVGSLDCLHLNIYVPNSAKTNAPLPVLVWIYGGGFQIGFAGRFLYGPKYFVRHDIILVTVNYRVGPYGFMCLNDPKVPGNQGFKDQLLALRWIKDNIGSFGGNSDKVTLFGESAGGISVDYHLFSKQEKLFNNLIIQSGTSFLPSLIGEPEETRTINLAAKLGFETTDLNEALSFLGKQSTSSVILAMRQVPRYLPCVENDFDDVEKFISDYPFNLDIPKAKDVAILIGHTDDERLVLHVNKNPDYYENLNIFYDKLSNAFNFTSIELADMVKYFRHFYIGDENITIKEQFNIIDFDSDFTYVHPTLRSIEKYKENDAGDIFYYVFSYNGDRNFVKKRVNITIGGAAHADEIGYLFDISYMKDEPSHEDQLVIDRMTTLWANFVKYSKPMPEISDLLPVDWKPVEDNLLHYLEIDSELTLKKRPFNKRMAFWDLFYRHNYKLQKGYRSRNN
ncbi:PREDICTED: juvenile hormone esterase-like isoform X2 [Papilio polytes]|uniref:juvenile hormone esterase-like isoform X2 n=1 Tax=Papilio polytes TaxID=76194 RepID=UPI000675F8A8|nr:PREDICTED: juvenile hormone esterase-like isoform X2 [Papilio polytes]